MTGQGRGDDSIRAQAAPTRCHPTLPIFGLAVGKRTVLYTPGQVAVVETQRFNTLRDLWQGTRHLPDAATARLAATLADAAATAVAAWERQIAAPFRPVCLTVVLSNRCNLACPYCYSAAADRGTAAPSIDEGRIDLAALTVAAHCRQRAMPLSLVIHGGGEASLHPKLVEQSVGLTRAAAEKAGVGWFGYIATNGVMPRQFARRLAGWFDLVGLSCDGPPDIQDGQRPTVTGGRTARRIESTADTVHAAGGRLMVRATVTAQSAVRLTEIVDYAHTRLGAAALRLEPVYGVNGRAGGGFAAADAPTFVQHYLAAEGHAQTLGLPIELAGARLDELHGPHCNFLKDVLQIGPNDAVLGCFLGAGGREGDAPTIGYWNANRTALALDERRIGHLRSAAGTIPSRCQGCINAYHCARDCPETCYAADEYASQPGFPTIDSAAGNSFRCRVQQLLTAHWLAQAVMDKDGHHTTQRGTALGHSLDSI